MENLSRERRSRWISAISRDDPTDDILENDRVCGRHFVSGKAAKGWDRFNVDWVPTLFLGHSKKAVGPKNLEKAAERSQRARDREQIKRPAQEQRKKEVEAERTAKRINLSEPGHQIPDVNFNFDDQIEETPNEKVIQTEKVVCKETSIQSEEYDYLFTPLKDHKAFDQHEFANNEDTDRFYTGLPSFDILNAVFLHVSPHVSRDTLTLTKFQEFALRLMKLKLDMSLKDLAFRFGVSLSTVSRVFSSWMIALDVRLSPLVSWPDREDLWRTMPQCFQDSFGKKVTVIIDCFEVFINRPSGLTVRHSPNIRTTIQLRF